MKKKHPVSSQASALTKLRQAPTSKNEKMSLHGLLSQVGDPQQLVKSTPSQLANAIVAAQKDRRERNENPIPAAQVRLMFDVLDAIGGWDNSWGQALYLSTSRGQPSLMDKKLFRGLIPEASDLPERPEATGKIFRGSAASNARDIHDALHYFNSPNIPDKPPRSTYYYPPTPEPTPVPPSSSAAPPQPQAQTQPQPKQQTESQNVASQAPKTQSQSISSERPPVPQAGAAPQAAPDQPEAGSSRPPPGMKGP